jgi:hypothetical protein
MKHAGYSLYRFQTAYQAKESVRGNFPCESASNVNRPRCEQRMRLVHASIDYYERIPPTLHLKPRAG